MLSPLLLGVLSWCGLSAEMARVPSALPLVDRVERDALLAVDDARWRPVVRSNPIGLAADPARELPRGEVASLAGGPPRRPIRDVTRLCLSGSRRRRDPRGFVVGPPDVRSADAVQLRRAPDLGSQRRCGHLFGFCNWEVPEHQLGRTDDEDDALADLDAVGEHRTLTTHAAGRFRSASIRATASGLPWRGPSASRNATSPAACSSGEATSRTGRSSP